MYIRRRRKNVCAVHSPSEKVVFEDPVGRRDVLNDRWPAGIFFGGGTLFGRSGAFPATLRVSDYSLLTFNERPVNGSDRVSASSRHALEWRTVTASDRTLSDEGGAPGFRRVSHARVLLTPNRSVTTCTAVLSALLETR